MQGYIESVHPANGTIVIRVFFEKTGKEALVDGVIGPDTEIYCEGRQLSISDLSVDDKVSVQGYRKDTANIATRIDILQKARKGTPASRSEGAAATHPAGGK